MTIESTDANGSPETTLVNEQTELAASPSTVPCPFCRESIAPDAKL
ncbi:hypothetical protein [Variovorax sp. SRS16]|nr:hypothetical protein [Variovorax sp. SRS16]